MDQFQQHKHLSGIINTHVSNLFPPRQLLISLRCSGCMPKVFIQQNAKHVLKDLLIKIQLSTTQTQRPDSFDSDSRPK